MKFGVGDILRDGSKIEVEITSFEQNFYGIIFRQEGCPDKHSTLPASVLENMSKLTVIRAPRPPRRRGMAL